MTQYVCVIGGFFLEFAIVQNAHHQISVRLFSCLLTYPNVYSSVHLLVHSSNYQSVRLSNNPKFPSVSPSAESLSCRSHALPPKSTHPVAFSCLFLFLDLLFSAQNITPSFCLTNEACFRGRNDARFPFPLRERTRAYTQKHEKERNPRT